MKSRRALRSEMRARRRAISEPERARMAGALGRHLGASLRVRRARRVACYLSNDGEMELGPVMDFLRANGRQVLLPALHGGGLWFLPYDRDTRLAPNRFGIPEPDVMGRARCRARDLDLVLMPLVAFDTTGNRLGMGGGILRSYFFLPATPRVLAETAAHRHRLRVPMPGNPSLAPLGRAPARRRDGSTIVSIRLIRGIRRHA